jgi:hypothetical protein
MTEDSRVIKRFKPFIMGKCRCGCNEDIPIRSGDYLQKYKRFHGIKGKNSNLWKTGLSRDRNGYLLIILPKHPFADSQGRIRLHRLVYELAYNCILLPWIEIHHIDNDKDNNSIKNLLPISKSLHGMISSTRDMSGRFCMICKSTKTKLDKYVYVYSPHWYRHPITNEEWLCRNCYRRELYKKKKTTLVSLTPYP